jgi:threonine dehydratase
MAERFGRRNPLPGTQIPRFEHIREASERIKGKVLRSPLVYSEPLSSLAKAQVFVKLDSLQPGGSFKLRGATNAVALLNPEERKKGVVAASSGNYGIALAMAARRAGVKATIVLPDNAPLVKVERIRRAGATILRYGAHYGDSERKAAELGKQEFTLIHPFDDPRVVAGQGSIALEIHQDAPEDLDLVLVPVGGGGLIAGIALGLKHTRPGAVVVGVEPEAAPSLTEAIKEGKPVPIEPLPTCADGLSPRVTGNISFEVAQERIKRVLLLTEEELMAGAGYCFHELKVVVEPSGAAGVAALIAGKLDCRSRTVIVILSGSNLDQKYFRDVMLNVRTP